MINDDKLLEQTWGFKYQNLGFLGGHQQHISVIKLSIQACMKNSGENPIVWDNGLGPDLPD